MKFNSPFITFIILIVCSYYSFSSAMDFEFIKKQFTFTQDEETNDDIHSIDIKAYQENINADNINFWRSLTSPLDTARISLLYVEEDFEKKGLGSFICLLKCCTHCGKKI